MEIVNILRVKLLNQVELLMEDLFALKEYKMFHKSKRIFKHIFKNNLNEVIVYFVIKP